MVAITLTVVPMMVAQTSDSNDSSTRDARIARNLDIFNSLFKELNAFYVDTLDVDKSMETAIGETNRRRKIQSEYNEANGITPKSVEKKVRELISISKKVEESDRKARAIAKDPESMSLKELEAEAERLRKLMNKAAAELEFEQAAKLRDRMIEVRKLIAEQG